MLTYEQLEKIRIEKLKAGETFIQHKSKYRQLEVFKKQLKAKLFLKQEGSIKEKESLVETHSDWIEFEEGRLAAQELADKWELVYKDFCDQWLTLYQQLKLQEEDRLHSYGGK